MSFRSCVSLKSKKEQLASYEDFRDHLSSNIVQHSWSNDLVANVNQPAEDGPLETSLNIQIENSWSESREAEQSEEGRSLTGVHDDFSCTESQEIEDHNLRLDSLHKPYSCTHCSYSSSYKSYLKSHMKKHTGEKPYKCTYCEGSFANSRYLKRHTMTHTGERPYSCSKCSYTCIRSHHLKSHMRQHHPLEFIRLHSLDTNLSQK